MKNFSIHQKNAINKAKTSINDSLYKFRESVSISFSNETQKEKLENILRLMKQETDTNSTNFDIYIKYFLRKNAKIKDDVIEKILNFLTQNNIHYKSIIKCIDSILELLIDNFQIINVLNAIIPILQKSLYQDENIKNIKAIHDITKCIGKLIKKGNTHIFGLVEGIIDSIFLNIFKYNSSESNLVYAYTNLLSEIMKNSITISFNNIIVKNNLGNFITLMEQSCCDKDKKIREMSAELTGNFIDMLKNRDNYTKKNFILNLYEILFNQFTSHTKKGNINSSSFYVVNGFLMIIKKIYELYPHLFNDDSLFLKLGEGLMKLKDSQYPKNIQLEFINFIPILYKMNIKIFKKEFIIKYLRFSNKILNSEPDLKMNYNLLVVLGKLNYYEQESINKYCQKVLSSLIDKLLLGKDFLNEHVLKCLSDLLNNKAGILSQTIILKINVFDLLPKIFKTPLSKNKVEFLTSLINYFNYYSMENCCIIILSLNTISQIICSEEFRLDNFLRFNENNNSKSLIPSKLSGIKTSINKEINKYLSDIPYKDKTSKAYLEMISNILTLFSNIRNNLFYKDMLIFYHYKLIPMTKYYKKEINKQIINIALCDFIAIDKNDENFSEFLIKNITEALINIFIFSKDALPKEDLINIFENKKIIIKIILKEKQTFFKKIIDLIDSSLNDNSKELLIKLISILEKNDNDNKAKYTNFIGNYVEALIFEILNTKCKIYEENLTIVLLYLTIHFKHLFFESLYEKILNISILIILNYEYKDFIIINALKIVIELLSNVNIKGKNIGILNNILYLLSVSYFIGASINDYLSEYMLKVQYLIIKLEEIDISDPVKFEVKDFIYFHSHILNYNLNKMKEYYEKLININKKLENVSPIKLIYNHLLKCENEDNSVIILKILGLSKTFSFMDLEKLNLNSDESLERKEDKYYLENDELKITIYKKFSQGKININYSYVESAGTKAILSLMDIVKYHYKKDLKIKIIQNLSSIINCIPLNQSYYLDIILPTIMQVLPQYETKYQNILIKNMTLIIQKFKEKSKSYIDEIVFLIYNYIEEPFLENVFNLLKLLFENYENKIRKYFYRLIPKILSIVKKDVPEKNSYLKLLIIITKNIFINPYIKLLLEDIKTLILNNKDLEFFKILLELLKEIVSKNDVYIYFPLIISTILRKSDLALKKTKFRKTSKSDSSLKSLAKNNQNPDINISILNNIFEILDIMCEKYRNYFLLFLPKIINYFTTNGIIESTECRQKLKSYINYENKYSFMTTVNFKKKIFVDYCKINCFYAFNSFSKLYKKDLLINKENEISNDLDLDKIISEKRETRDSFSNRKLNKELIKNRRSNNDIILKSFNNSNYTLELDWIDWYRKVIKSLFEQNPSTFIYIHYFITEYYFNMASDLNLYSFLTVYNNNTDNNKAIIINCLDKALMHPKTPEYIIIAITNLMDFMSKMGVQISYRDYKDLGKIAYNCKAYTKALYYNEKGFETNLSFERIDDIIDLYYKLNVTENGVGLIKLSETDEKLRNINEYDKKYLWYINMHDYDTALKIINEKLSQEMKQKNIKDLKNYRNICLFGLCDWETILSEEEDEFENLKIDSKKESENKINGKEDNKELVEKKLLYLKSSLALGNWDKLIKYMDELKDIFIEKKGKDYPDYELKIKDKNIIDAKEKEQEKNFDYISYNDLINKNEFQFLKYDESIFDLNIYSIVINIKYNNIDIARKYINNCQKLLINKIKVLIKESYTKENDAILKNQCLEQMEEYCNYKQYHYNDKQYLEQMKSRFNVLNKNLSKYPDLYMTYIGINSLIFPIEEEYYRYIDLSKVYRKSGQFIQAENILNILKKKLNIKDNYLEDKHMIFDEKRIKIELSYNKCLFAKGNVDRAVKNMENLINLLKDKELGPYNNLRKILKSKIYGNYAIYKFNQLSKNKIRSDISRQKSENINVTFSRQITSYLNEHNLVTILPKKKDSDKAKKVKFKLDEKVFSNKYINEYNEKLKHDKKNLSNLSYLIERDDVKIVNEFLELATQFNNKSYKYWHNYAMLNYKCYKYFYNRAKEKNEINYKEKIKYINYAINAVNGFKQSLLIANKNKVRTLEDSLRFIDIFFEIGNQDENLLSLIKSTINDSDLEIFIGIIPQLTCRFDIRDEEILNVLTNLLSKIFSIYPEALLFPLISIKNSKIIRNRRIAETIMESQFMENYELKELSQEYEEFVKELNKCSVLYHEEWIEAIETCEELYKNKYYNIMVDQLLKLHSKMNKTPESLYEMNFYQLCGDDLKEAEKKLHKLLTKQKLNYLKEAWAIYQTVLKNIKSNYTNFQTISLQYISSKLFNFKNSNIIIPSFIHSYLYDVYDKNFPVKSNDLKQNIKPVKIKQIDKYLYILQTKYHPRKITMIGTNDKEYLYLLKGHEDLRQDEKVTQIFNLVNLIMSKEKTNYNLDLLIMVYSVIPLSNKSGLIGWVHDCDSLDKLIKEYRKNTKKILNIERNTLLTNNPVYESSILSRKVETFEYVINHTKDSDLRHIIWLKSQDCESWFIRTTNYSRSLAVMSMVGYILGLGDRYLNNILMNRKTGKIVHIDFSECFEVSMKRDKYPDRVPFRLTRMLVRALGISGVEGLFRLTCEKTMLLLRNNRDSLLAILSALVHNPLISFRLLIPLILKDQKNKHKKENKLDNNIPQIYEEDLIEKKYNKNKIIVKDKRHSDTTVYKLRKNKLNNDKDKEDEFEGDNERQILEREQRQIFNSFEENNEIDAKELYKIAQLVLSRINSKLTGMDFNNGIQYNEKVQVDILIREARSEENLAMSYLGWLPYW